MEKIPCKRCDGAGILPQFRHVQGGVCFRCDGAGADPGRAPRVRVLRPRPRGRRLTREARVRLAALIEHGGSTEFTRITPVGRELRDLGLVRIEFDRRHRRGTVRATGRGARSYHLAIAHGLLPNPANAERHLALA